MVVMVITGTDTGQAHCELREEALRLQLLFYSFWLDKQRGKGATSAVPSAG